MPPPAAPPTQALPLLAAGPSAAQKIKMIRKPLEIIVGIDKKQNMGIGQYCGSGMFIPVLNFSIPDPGFRVKHILVLGSRFKKIPDPGSDPLQRI